MKIVFMGTPRIAEIVLSYMVDAGYKPGLVVTQPDREKNRGKKVLPSEVKTFALEHEIPVLQPEKIKGNTEFVDALKDYNPDIAVVVAYGRILPKEVLDIPRLGSINIHASLLPKYRGASPIQHAILSGDDVTGVTIMKMDEGMDTGDMLLKEELAIRSMNAEELSDALGELGGELIVKALPLIENGSIAVEAQDDALATYTRMIKKEDGRINFKEYSASEIERMTRAFYPWPGVTVGYEGESMKLSLVEALDEEFDGSSEFTPGDVIKCDDSGVKVLTKEGILLIKEMQLPGKNKVDAAAFLRGHKITKESFNTD